MTEALWAGGSTANKWPVAIAILDATGSLIMQNLDNTHTRSAEIVIGKGAHRARLSAAKQGHGAGQRLFSVRNIGAGR
jgi:uncharacterized protein GlcG (DUF336 family)